MASKFRVRFVGDSKSSRHKTPITAEPSSQPLALDIPNKRRKSRFACLECKRRHVKCDETFPVCLRCQHRGTSCHSPFRSAQWQMEVPGLTMVGLTSNMTTNYNHRALQYWLEKASQIMVIDPNINPYSSDILRYLEKSQSLIHGIQSLSLAHEKFFGASSLKECLEERGHALSLVRRELGATERPSPGTLLAVVLLGLSSVWVHHQTGDDFGQGHLPGARAILDILLANPDSSRDSLIRLAVATYLLWDQSIAFLQDPAEQTPLYTADLFCCVQTMSSEYNATVGYLAKIMYQLGDVGRYCRMIIDGWCRDLQLEDLFEGHLTVPEGVDCDIVPSLVNECFQKHGLIMLYRSIESAQSEEEELLATQRQQVVKQCAKDILENIENIPENSHYHCILGQPLLSAGSELSHDDALLREKVRERFRRLFSLTRFPANLYAIEFLEEVWKLKDGGENVFWMSHLLKKDRIFVLC